MNNNLYLISCTYIYNKCNDRIMFLYDRVLFFDIKQLNYWMQRTIEYEEITNGNYHKHSYAAR